MFPITQEPLGKKYPLYSSSCIRRWGKSGWRMRLAPTVARCFELRDVLSGAGVEYLKHSLNMASI